MKIPVIRGVIDRRILVNYHVDPDVLAALLPAPFRPKIFRGAGLAGICLIRLRRVRPAFVPSWLGIASENAAHRVAVEWDENGAVRGGVFVSRRDTDSRVNTLGGGRLFPGIHHQARFAVEESADRYSVAVGSDDGATTMQIRAYRTERWPPSSVFRSLQEASEFFRADAVGYSAAAVPRRFQGLELRCLEWQAEPLEVEKLQSSYFDDASLFPKGAIGFDCALLMRGIAHEWHGLQDLSCAQTSQPAA